MMWPGLGRQPGQPRSAAATVVESRTNSFPVRLRWYRRAETLRRDRGSSRGFVLLLEVRGLLSRRQRPVLRQATGCGRARPGRWRLL